MSTRSILPTSGTVLGAIVDDLDLRLPEAIGKSAREYFAGRRPIIKDETRLEIVLAIAQALVDQGYIPDLGALPPPLSDSDTANATARTIVAWAHQWDDLVGHLQSEGLGEVPHDVVAMACLRLIAVDTALRSAAALRLATGRPTNCECELCGLGTVHVPDWPHVDGQRKMIHAIMKQIGPRAQTLEGFAHLLDLVDSTIDGWVRTTDPSRVSENAIDLMATALAQYDPKRKGAREMLRVELRWRFALSRITTRLAAILGRSRVIDVAFGLKRFFTMTMEFLRRSRLSDEEFRQSMLFTIIFGVRAPRVPFVLNTLARNEPDEAWVSSFRAAENDWLTHITTTIATEHAKAQAADVLHREDGLGSASAKMFTEIIDKLGSMPLPPALLTTPFAKANALVALAFEARKRGDLPSTVVYLKGAVEQAPDCPELHQDFGGGLRLIQSRRDCDPHRRTVGWRAAAGC